MGIDQMDFTKELEKKISGDVLLDKASLGIYSTDASLYQIMPLAVVLPKNDTDVTETIKVARDHGISILPRGGGTSLAGQTVGESIILDFSKYMNRILEFNAEERWIKIQPGLVRDELNQFLAPHGLHFAPDPATSSRANVGGMIGNNSSGTKSILFGKTVDHVLELKVLLADGTLLEMASLSEEEYSERAKRDDREGKIYSAFRQMIFENSTAIEEAFPKVMRRVQGYNLDEFIHTNQWNLAKLICGSEGTLGTILEAKINLEPLPKYKSVCVVHFEEVMEAIRAVEPMLPFQPSAIEILDKHVLELAKNNLTTQRHTRFLEGQPGAVQIVEFYGHDRDEIRQRQLAMIDQLKKENLGYAYPIFNEGAEMQDVWLVRKKGLGLMLGMKSSKKPLAFIEDASIPIRVLPEYIEKVLTVCKKYETEAAAYAHASVGVIHVRPILDMRDGADIERFKSIAEETFQLVKHYGGSWSGEHGDGLVRSYFLKEYFGDHVYGLLKQVKELFDPDHLMNPGKIIDAPPIDENLRYGTKYQDQPLETIYHYREDGNFQNAVHMCTGVGECRKTSSGTMCPSYRATRDEEHSTRGRANILRLAMSGQLGKNGLTDDRVMEALDLCLSCKACKSECPSNVDMAKLKSEVLQAHYDQNGISSRDVLIKRSDVAAAKFSGPLAGMTNLVMKSKIIRFALEKAARLDRRRIPPTYASQTFVAWYRKNYKPSGDEKETVILFVDTYLNYHEPEIGRGAIALLDQLEIGVQIADIGCCQRPKISHGFLRDAKKEGQKVLYGLDEMIKEGHPVIVCEPSCYSALVDDLCDLTDDVALAESIQSNVYTSAQYIARKIEESDVRIELNKKVEEILIHGHCHEKALTGTRDLQEILNRIPDTSIKEIPSGCCGMAGSFGYEKEHYNLSKKIAHEVLIPAIDQSDQATQIVANGFSCRHQIADFSNRKAQHWLALFA